MWYVTRGITDKIPPKESWSPGSQFDPFRSTTFPNQGILDWGSREQDFGNSPGNGPFYLGHAGLLSGNTAPAGYCNSSRPFRWNGSPRLAGMQVCYAASVCFFEIEKYLFDVGSTEDDQGMTLRIGNRYSAVLQSRLSHETRVFENGTAQGWLSHLASTTGNDDRFMRYMTLAIYNGTSEVARQKIPIWLPPCSDGSVLSAGFCKIDGQAKFFAWASIQPHHDLFIRSDSFSGDRAAWRGFFEYVPAFGGGTAFLSIDVDDEAGLAGGYGGRVYATFPASFTGNCFCYTAAEKTTPYTTNIDAIPRYTATRIGNPPQQTGPQDWLDGLGKTISSFRSHHANFLCPATQWGVSKTSWRANENFLTQLDCGGHTELFPYGVAGNANGDWGAANNVGSRLFFVNTHMGYKNRDAVSWLPSGLRSNIHHDLSKNWQLNSLRAILNLSDGALVANNLEVALETSDDYSLNTYTGEGIGTSRPYSWGGAFNWKIKVLVSLLRRDFFHNNNLSDFGGSFGSGLRGGSVETNFWIVVSVSAYDIPQALYDVESGERHILQNSTLYGPISDDIESSLLNQPNGITFALNSGYVLRGSMSLRPTQ